MRLTRQGVKPTGPTLNIASLVDVVFLLLIFFMCTSSFDRLEGTLPAEFPGRPKTPAELVEDFDPVQIDLTRSGGSVLVRCDGEPCGTFAILQRHLEARRALADVPVIIAGEESVPLEYMVGALDACRTAGFERVAFSTGAPAR